MELSILCGTKVMLCVLDKYEKLTFYTTDNQTLELFKNSLKDKNIEKDILTDSNVNF